MSAQAKQDRASLQQRSARLQGVKALDRAEGVLEAIVSVFDVVDHAGERIKPGAFARSLERGLPYGVWMHDWSAPVAKTLEARELLAGDPLLPAELAGLGGLYVKAQFNLETQRGREAFSDVAGGYVDQFSIGYWVVADRKAPDGVRDLLEVELAEWSPVLVGCNPATMPLSAKSATEGMPESATESPGPEAPRRGPGLLAGEERTKTLRLPDGAEFKAQYLGPYAETEMTVAALRDLADSLFYRCVYDVLLWNDDDLTPAEQVAFLRGAFAEFAQIATRVVEAMLVAAADEPEAAAAVEVKRRAALQERAATVQSLWARPEAKASLPTGEGSAPDGNGAGGSARGAGSYEEQLCTTLAAVRDCTDRGRGIRAIRSVKGADLGPDRLRQLAELHAEVKALEGELAGLTRPAILSPDLRRLRMAHAERAARLRGLLPPHLEE